VDVWGADRYCFSVKKVWISFFHSLFSLFLAVFWIIGTDSFAAQLLASIRCLLIHLQPSHLRYVSLARFLHQFLSFLFCRPISTSAKKINHAVFNVNRWWTLECCYHGFVCVWFDAYYIWMQGGFPTQELHNKITNLTTEGRKNRRLHRKPLRESSGNYNIFYLIAIFIFSISVFIPRTEALYFMEQRAASASSHKFL
jgi:hypothetical protein